MSSEELFALLKPTTEPLTEEALEEFYLFRDRSFGTIDERGLYFRFSGRSSALLICHFLAQKLSRLSQTRCLCTSWKILPFLEKQDLGRILQKILAASENPEQRLSELEDLLPFLDESTLVTLVGYFPVSSEVLNCLPLFGYRNFVASVAKNVDLLLLFVNQDL